MDNEKRAYLELHIAVLLFGITAILGDLISLSAIVLVWWRVLMASLSILLMINFGRKLHLIPKRLILQYMGIGVIVALHWIAFFGAIKLANASIALVCMATTSFFTAFLEPYIMQERYKLYEIGLSMLIIPGMILVVNFTELSMQNGIWVGLIAAFLAALFATLNKKLIEGADPLPITFLELSTACLFISFLLPFYYQQIPNAAFWPVGLDWLYLGILALGCTTLAYVLSLRSLKYLSAFAANLTVNLEPVYGIILAWIILKEHQELNSGFYFGGAIIILAVLCYPILKKKFENKVHEKVSS